MEVDTLLPSKRRALIVEKLKKEGLFLDFIYKNQMVGLPFNIPFKKGYIK